MKNFFRILNVICVYSIPLQKRVLFTTCFCSDFQSDIQSDAELSVLSARSRSTLRSQYKLKLEESKMAAEDRRSRSPTIALMPSNTMDTDQQQEEDELEADLINGQGMETNILQSE